MMEQTVTELELIAQARQSEIRHQVEASRCARSGLLDGHAARAASVVTQRGPRLAWRLAAAATTVLLLAGS